MRVVLCEVYCVSGVHVCGVVRDDNLSVDCIHVSGGGQVCTLRTCSSGREG